MVWILLTKSNKNSNLHETDIAKTPYAKQLTLPRKCTIIVIEMKNKSVALHLFNSV
jgi:hypothetical protein